jgi:hypothetical protein
MASERYLSRQGLTIQHYFFIWGKLMKTKFKLMTAALAMTSLAAQAELNLTGPISAATGSFPTYYQDTTGLALDLCLPAVGPEWASGMCILADLPSPNAAITFPTNFPDESFWWMGDGSLVLPDGSDALLVMAMEAAFANGAPIAGDQVVFARIRVRFVAPTTGHYTVTHPYGVEEFDAVAGERVFFTDDHGVLCGSDFSCAANGRIGPFLRPSATPGGDPTAPVVVDGKTYIADPGVETTVTGSPHGTNIFRIEGPDGVSENNLFTVMGRVHTDPLPSNTNVESATYSRSSNGNSVKIDVHAKSVKALGEPVQKLKLFGEGIPGTSLVKNSNNSTQFYGQLALNTSNVPAEIYLSDLNETPNRIFTANLVDHVTVKQAVYDGVSQTLHIEAESSDKKLGDLPILSAQGSDGDSYGQLTNDALDVPNVSLPPAKVIVRSNKGGRAELVITTTASAPTLPGLVTVEDHFADASSPFNVIDNDSDNGDKCQPSNDKVKIVKQPAHGAVTVNEADQSVSYTQNDSVNGWDSFSYYLTDATGTNVSNVSKVNFAISNGNLPPVATPDFASAAVGATIIIDPLTNDTDPENGGLTLVSVTGAGATKVGNTISYTAALPVGTKTIEYTVSDGDKTATSTITVTIDAAEVVAVTAAEFRTSKLQWRISGTDTPARIGVVMSVYSNGGSFLLGTATTDVTGAWNFRATAPQRPGPIVVKSSRGAQSLPFNLTVRN